MYFQSIVEAQQKKVSRIELRHEKRSLERFETAWQEIQQTYAEFLGEQRITGTEPT